MKMPLEKTKCIQCDRGFSYYTKNRRGIFCSHKCCLEYQKTDPDYKKNKSDKAYEQWEKQKAVIDSEAKGTVVAYRKSALEYYGSFCRRCDKEFKEEDLQVHHVDQQSWNHQIENLVVLCKSCHKKAHRELKKQSSLFTGEQQIKKAVANIIRTLGFKLDHPDYLETPNRVARMYHEMCYGAFPEAKEEVKEILGTKFPSTYEGIIIINDIQVWSMCPHHLMPVLYSIDVGVIADKSCLGLSKIPRLVELLAKKPVLQETLTKEITSTLDEHLKTAGSICHISGVHSCMQARGIKAQGTRVITNSATGVFLNPKGNKNPKIEFLNSIKNG